MNMHRRRRTQSYHFEFPPMITTHVLKEFLFIWPLPIKQGEVETEGGTNLYAHKAVQNDDPHLALFGVVALIEHMNSTRVRGNINIEF
mmetsp:Transcript_29198/g.38931  ORF Transcript_29198/g.38931 Transcript_29198/m.38931 type:complete len:88 (+) Transcript_29198:771-1034(+)